MAPALRFFSVQNISSGKWLTVLLTGALLLTPAHALQLKATTVKLEHPANGSLLRMPGQPVLASIVGKILSGTASTVVRWAIIILFTAMGLQSMGVADSIIEMAFGALVIGAAAAAVLAFGLGGRDAAARQLAKFESSSKGGPAPSADGSAPVPPRPESQG